MSKQTVQLNEHTHDSVVEMMNSVDTENKVVALSCIENVDFNGNLVYILLLKRQGKATAAEWTEHAPKATGMLKALGVNMEEPVTWKDILDVLIKQKASPDHMQFYLDRYAVNLYTSIKGLGYEFIDRLEITLKLKSNDQQSRATSESI